MDQNSPSGVIAAVPTPISEDGGPDIDRFLRHAGWALDNGCDGLNVLGTTGEATSFSTEERKRVMKAAATELDASRLLVGTGMPDMATTVELTRAAHEHGFAGALVLPPFYYKGVSDDGLFAWFETLVDETAASAVPLYLYNFPQMTGITFAPRLVGRLVQAFPQRVLGAKDSSGDLDYAGELAKIDGFAVFPSSETALASADRMGFAGCISATVNVAPRLSAALWADRTNPELLEKAARIRRDVSAQPLIPAVKYLVGKLQGEHQFAQVRPPLMPLSGEQQKALDAIELARTKRPPTGRPPFDPAQ